MGRGGCLFEAGRLLTFIAIRVGAYSRWALFGINTIPGTEMSSPQDYFLPGAKTLMSTALRY